MIDPRLTAYHEAGHAVIGLSYGFPLDRIVTELVQLEGGFIGVASCRWITTRDFVLQEFDLDHVARMAAAGCYAELVALQTDDLNAVDPELYIFDVAQLRDQIGARGGDDSNATTARRFQDAIYEVEDVYRGDPRLAGAHEMIYEQVLDALLKNREYLPGDHVIALFRQRVPL